MIEFKQSTNYSVQFWGFHIPKGSVYAVLSPCVMHGRYMPKMYVWATDFDMIRNQRHFYVHVLRIGDARPKRIYVDSVHGYARALKRYICACNPSALHVSYGATLREIRPHAPKDRKVGTYVMRGVPSFDTSPNVETGDYVTNGCKVGHNFYNEEGYCYTVLGMHDSPI